jgi:hypothetical protein
MYRFIRDKIIMYNKKVARAKANEGILALDFCDTGISLK